MVITLQDHISLLQSFLSNPTSTNPQQAAEATFHITRAAAQSTAPKSAITLAQTTLTTLSKTPCIPAIPHLLSVCENDPFEALDVFVLSSAAWKALVAAAITAPPEPHLAMRIISCAALNATGMIAKCLQPSTHTSAEVVRTVKIAKFYCLNAARCSRAFFNSIQHLSPELLLAPFLHLFDFLAFSSFVLLFDHHALLPAHDELHAEVFPLVTKTLKTMLAMVYRLSKKDRDRVVKEALESTGRHQTLTDLRLPTPVLQLLAVLQVAHCALHSRRTPNKLHESEPANRDFVICLLIPFLFDCFDVAYEEIILFRVRGSAAAFLDIVTSATVDIVSTAECGVEQAGKRQVGLDFLIEQVASDNAVRSHVAQEVLLHMATIQNAHDSWRDFVTATIFACLRTSLTMNCDQADRWQRLAVELCVVYIREGETLINALATSRRLCNASQSRKANPSAELLDDPISIILIAQTCDVLSQRDTHNTPPDANTQPQMRDPVLVRTLHAFQLDAKKVAGRVQDLALASTGYGTVNAIHLLPRVLDNKPTCVAALSVLQRESSTPPMISAALRILDPSTMQPDTVDAACTAAASVERKYGLVVCPSISAFVSKAAYCLGETISLIHWKRLSALLESCLITSREDAELRTPPSYALTAAVLHYAAIALSVITSTSRTERQTQASLPAGILHDVEDALKHLEIWRTGENGCDLEEERGLVRAERSWTEMPLNFDSVDRMRALYSIREAREQMLEAASTLLDDSNRVSVSEDVNEELLLLQNSIRFIARCHQPSRG